MSQRELDREIARATGESVAAIRRHGFSEPCPLVEADDLDLGDLGPQIIDWDEVEAQRNVPLFARAVRFVA